MIRPAARCAGGVRGEGRERSSLPQRSRFLLHAMLALVAAYHAAARSPRGPLPARRRPPLRMSTVLAPRLPGTNRNLARVAVAAALATAGIAGYGRFIRPWHLRWGATDDEVTRELPGDKVVIAPTFDATRAVTVEASPEAVWPWIAQLGFGRAGWYSYDLLDNLGRPSADRIIACLQEVQVGDIVPMGPGGAGLRIKDLVPRQVAAVVGRDRPQHLALEPRGGCSRPDAVGDPGSDALPLGAPVDPLRPAADRAVGLSDDAEVHARDQASGRVGLAPCSPVSTCPERRSIAPAPLNPSSPRLGMPSF